jgi:RNA polymerase sigma-70 factor (ECF subfamily)
VSHQPVTEVARRTDPSKWVADHGDALLRFALGRVRHADVAEDLVQEAFLAALRSRSQFAGNSSERTWLLSILRHKLLDHVRRQSREQPASAIASDALIDEWFDRGGHWKRPPAEWLNPSAACESAEFWTTFAQCVEGLPRSLAAAFSLRALDDMTSAEVCTALNVSPSHFHVMMHRARLRLWRCLNIHWFDS